MNKFGIAAAMIVAAVGTAAQASPVINGATINGRIFNDFPGSNFNSVNAFPATVQLNDGNLLGPGFANRHNFRLSSDGGATNAQFGNGDSFSIAADVNISVTGTGGAEGGLQVSPWWSPNVDGQFNLRTTDGEVAVFGGRLPFYSFTANHGVTYTAGTTVRCGIEYEPRNLDAGLPGVIRYTYGAFSSGWIPFDEGNQAEGVVYGNWGILNGATVGGLVQVFGTPTQAGSVSATFGNIVYTPAPGSAALLGLAGLAAARRRR